VEPFLQPIIRIVLGFYEDKDGNFSFFLNYKANTFENISG
jgi:hypothetical protein